MGFFALICCGSGECDSCTFKKGKDKFEEQTGDAWTHGLCVFIALVPVCSILIALAALAFFADIFLTGLAFSLWLIFLLMTCIVMSVFLVTRWGEMFEGFFKRLCGMYPQWVLGYWAFDAEAPRFPNPTEQP